MTAITEEQNKKFLEVTKKNFPGKYSTSTEYKIEKVNNFKKVSLEEGKLTGVISISTGENRKERRATKQVRQRVRNKSPITSHNPNGSASHNFYRKYFNNLKQINQGKDKKLTSIPQNVLDRVNYINKLAGMV